MKTLRTSITLLFVSFFLFSCSSGNEQKGKEPVAAKDSMPAKENYKGGTVMHMTCGNDASQSYELYLPSTYSIAKNYPLMVAFDAHGDGSLPVNKYKAIAEKYGYILAGSNNSKNGQSFQESAAIAENLFTDLRAKLAVDLQRFYLMGFSGGARVANGITIVNGAITGVICCGAAAPAVNSEKPRENYYYIGIAGLRDFNYPELAHYDMVDLAGYHVKHALLTFDGKHEWPDSTTMQQAFWWMELNQMRKDPKYRNDQMIQAELKPLLEQIEKNKKENKSYANYLLCKRTINFYENLADLSALYDLWKELKNDPQVDKGLKKEEGIWQEEDKQKAFYVRSLQDKDQNWWKSEVANLNQKIKTGKDQDEVHMYQRILDYLSLVCYMQTTGALQQKNKAAAEYFNSLYLLVDPSNNEAHYLKANLNAMDGNKEAAFSALKKAIELGFKDKTRMEADSSFNTFLNDAAFQNMLQSIAH